jgi:hypothetical protein
MKNFSSFSILYLYRQHLYQAELLSTLGKKKFIFKSIPVFDRSIIDYYNYIIAEFPRDVIILVEERGYT